MDKAMACQILELLYPFQNSQSARPGPANPIIPIRRLQARLTPGQNSSIFTPRRELLGSRPNCWAARPNSESLGKAAARCLQVVDLLLNRGAIGGQDLRLAQVFAEATMACSFCPFCQNSALVEDVGRALVRDTGRRESRPGLDDAEQDAFLAARSLVSRLSPAPRALGSASKKPRKQVRLSSSS